MVECVEALEVGYQLREDVRTGRQQWGDSSPLTDGPMLPVRPDQPLHTFFLPPLISSHLKNFKTLFDFLDLFGVEKLKKVMPWKWAFYPSLGSARAFFKPSFTEHWSLVKYNSNPRASFKRLTLLCSQSWAPYSYSDIQLSGNQTVV